MAVGRKELALFAVSVALCAGATEIALRAMGVAYPIFHKLDPIVDGRRNPGPVAPGSPRESHTS